MNKPLTPSLQQEAIFEDIASGEGHTIVEALAGSGKTTTIVAGLDYLPEGADTLVVAFNKPIADTMKARVPPGVAVSTLHSYGLRQLRSALSHQVKIDEEGDKVREILVPLLTQAWKGWEPENKEDEKPLLDALLWGSRGPIKKLLSMAKSTLSMKPEAIDAMIDDYGLEIPPTLSRSQAIAITAKAIDACLDRQDLVDYDDMIFFPCALKMPMETYARVFVDEAQDLSISQVKLALKACKEDGRITAVGDRFQAIYQFRGAGSDSIAYIKKRLDAKTLKLTVSYRCAKSIVRLAQEIVPDFEAAPGAPEGVVRDIDISRASPEAGDFVISRTNAPLVQLFFRFVKEGKRVAIQGRDIGSRLRSLILKADRGVTKGSVPAMLSNVEKWREKEIARLTKLDRDTAQVHDVVACIFAIAEDASDVDAVIRLVDSLFNDDPAGDKSRITLTSGHRSKGLERDRVWLLRDTFMKSRPNKVDGKIIWTPPNEEEKRIYYVALTRARRELVLVHGRETEPK